jgi:transglutaminase-like putative cysteine protease
MPVRYTLSCELSYEIRAPTVFIFNLEVARLQRHVDVAESLIVGPELPIRRYTSPDTKNRYFSVAAPTGDLSVSYKADVTLNEHRADPNSISEVPLAGLPLDIMPFLLPSRYVSSDRLARIAEKEFGCLSPGHNRVTAICNWIYEHLEYQRGSSTVFTTADEAFLMRAGVCRDFAHLGIAFCRALNIPARFVSCYAHGLEPCDFHAVFEAYLSGRWWLFDATRQADLDGLVRIGVGRDAAEIAFASPFGEIEPGPMSISIAYADGSPGTLNRTVDAISTEEPASNAGAR